MIQELLSVQSIADLGAEDGGEGVARDEEAGMGGLAPSLALVGQPAGGDEEVNVRMVGEITGPGVEHREDAEGSADPLWIVGEVLEGGCGFAQEQVVDGALVGACERAELGGESEGDELVGTGQESSAQAFEPELRRAIVTLWAVSVAARVVGVVEAFTGVADEQGATESRCPAVDDVRHGLSVRRQHAVAIDLPVGLPGAAEDLRQLDHDRWRLASLHQAIDGVFCRVANLPSEMSVDGGSARAGMAEVLLDESEIDAVLEQVSGIGVTQGVDVSALVQAAPLDGVSEGALQTVASDGSAVVGNGVLGAVASGGRKEPGGRAVGTPVVSQQLESGVGQRHLTFLLALAADVKNAAGTVDVGDLKGGALHEAQATGVNRGQAEAVDVDAHSVEDAPDLVAAEHHRELLFRTRLGDIQALPVAAERFVVEEAEASEDDGEGATGDVLVELQMQQVAADLVFSELVGRPVIVACQLGDGVDVALNSARGVAPELHLLYHLAA